MCERCRRWHHSSGPSSAGRRRARPPSSSAPPHHLPSHLGVARCTGGRPPHGAPSSRRRLVAPGLTRAGGAARTVQGGWCRRRRQWFHFGSSSWRCVAVSASGAASAPAGVPVTSIGFSSWLPSSPPCPLAGSCGRRAPSCRDHGERTLFPLSSGVDGISFTVHP